MLRVTHQLLTSLAQRFSAYELICSRFVSRLNWIHDDAATKLVNLSKDDFDQCLGRERWGMSAHLRYNVP